MSDDIVERLRALSEVTTEWRHIALHYDAADEIERLRAEIAGYKENEIQLESRIEWMRERIKEMEIDSVRSARLVGWRL